MVRQSSVLWQNLFMWGISKANPSIDFAARTFSVFRQVQAMFWALGDGSTSQS